MRPSAVALLALAFALTDLRPARGADRPNIFLAIADDWGYPHAGAYGDPVVKTSTFDRLAREGVLFAHAYVSSPSCTPSRSALLTGQYHWRLKGPRTCGAPSGPRGSGVDDAGVCGGESA